MSVPVIKGGEAEGEVREGAKKEITRDRHAVLLAKRCTDPISSQAHSSM